MEYYQVSMIILGSLGVMGSITIFAIKVLRYLWRIEQTLESLVNQINMIIEDNKKRDERLQTFEVRFDTIENADRSARKRFLAG